LAGVLFIGVLLALALIVIGLGPLAMGRRKAGTTTRVVGTAAWLLSIGVLSFLIAGIILIFWIFRHGTLD
jgi:hypothetical protein